MLLADDIVKAKLKFLGMKWRFLRFDLENETFPPLRPGPQTQESIERQSNLEQSVVLETFEKGLNLSQSMSLHAAMESSIISATGSGTPYDMPISRCTAAQDDSVESIDRQGTFYDSTTSMGPGCAMSELDSVFTEEDIMVGLRNMQMFHKQEPVHPLPPSIARRVADPAKTLAFSPRPPEATRPSAAGTGRLSSPRAPGRHLLPGRHHKVPPGPSLQEQVLQLDIGREFKL